MRRGDGGVNFSWTRLGVRDEMAGAGWHVLGEVEEGAAWGITCAVRLGVRSDTLGFTRSRVIFHESRRKVLTGRYPDSEASRHVVGSSEVSRNK